MSEKALEQALRQAIQADGGICWKLVSPGVDGVPDRLCLKAGRAVFVEVKAPGKRPRPLQQRRMRQLRERGFTCLVIDSMSQIEEVRRALSAS